MGEKLRGKGEVPAHIGIIMDGNGRWAKKRGFPRAAGHAAGAEVFQRIVRHCEKIGVKAVTVYAFSTENWKRPKSEVDAIMGLLRKYLDDAFGLSGETIKVRFIGDRGRLDSKLRNLMNEIEDVSKNNPGLILNIGINYGGREEIARAARLIAKSAADGEIAADDIDVGRFGEFLYTAGSPPVDLILRPGGERRISNFLLWQCAYSELIFIDKLWPDMTPADVDWAIEEYNGRSRRFGGV